MSKPAGKPATWTESAPLLVDVAMGRKHADLVVRNGRLVSVYSGEIIAGIDIAVVAGRFAFVGQGAEHCIGPKTKVVFSVLAGLTVLLPSLPVPQRPLRLR